MSAAAMVIAGLVLALATGASFAQSTALRIEDRETIDAVEATVTLLDGRVHTGRFVVTHFRPKGKGPFPLVVLSHGRDMDDRASVGRMRMLHVVDYWLARGFAVVVPTRMGYGESGLEPDVEFSGEQCGRRDFWPGFRAAAEQIKATLAFARRQPWADRRAILMGQSYGGLASVVATSLPIDGIIGAINTAGTSGANPDVSPGRPCSPDALEDVARRAGATSRVPQIWIYADNDTYAGPPLPARWHQAFVAAGGKATFVPLAALPREGHYILDDLSTWRPHADALLASLGIPTPRTANRPPPTRHAALGDTAAIPYVDEVVRRHRYPRFLQLDLPRAFVLSPGGAWAYRTGPRALEDATKACNDLKRGDCRAYAVDDDVVWREQR